MDGSSSTFFRWRSLAPFLLLCLLPNIGLEASSRPAMGPYLNGALPDRDPSGLTGFRAVQAYTGFTFGYPMQVLHDPRDEERLILVSRIGEVWSFRDHPTEIEARKILDLTDRAAPGTGAEDGLQSIAFHPEFGDSNSSNRNFVYVFYTTPRGTAYPNSDGLEYLLRVSRFTWPEGVLTLDASSEQILIEQSAIEVHYGGSLAFGPDGFLYVSVGDGLRTFQRIDFRLQGGILRIDVDQDPSRSGPILRQPDLGTSAHYGIPHDNPWAGDPNTLGEFYALGLRNPFRMTIDPMTGDIWLGDVGAASFEEINRIISGGNYEWPEKEGPAANDPPSGPLIGSRQAPTYFYDRSVGQVAIGGIVYRGPEEAIHGLYLFGDFIRGSLSALDPNDPGAGVRTILAEGGAPWITSFGTDRSGRLLMTTLFGGERIFRLEASDEEPPPVPQLLSEVGAFSDLARLEPAPGVAFYTLNSPLWSDGALKKRWIAIPGSAPFEASEQIAFDPAEPFSFPTGSVFIKHFELPDENQPGGIRRLETRFMVQLEDGSFYGLTYRWREDQQDAVLVAEAGYTESIERLDPDLGWINQTWDYPSRQQCIQCHTPTSGYVLGFNAAQIDRAHPSISLMNQITWFSDRDYFQEAVSSEVIDTVTALAAAGEEAATLEHRFKSYLQANCASCHQPGSGVRALFDARALKPLIGQHLIGTGLFEDPNQSVIVPGDPEASRLYQRVNSVGHGQMPPVGKNIVDTEAVAMIRDFILSIESADNVPEEFTREQLGVESYQGAAELLPNGEATLAADGFYSHFEERGQMIAKRVQGNFRVQGRVDGRLESQTDERAPAGLMVRSALYSTARQFSISELEDGSLMAGNRRWITGNDWEETLIATSARWLRIVRTGDIYQSAYSEDGLDWTVVDERTMPISGTVYAGPFFSGGFKDQNNVAWFSGVEVESGGFRIESETPFIGEGEEREVTFRRLGSPGASVTLTYTLSGSASASDVSGLSGSVFFPVGVSEQTVTVQASTGGGTEGVESLILTPQAATNYSDVAPFTLTIAENAREAWYASLGHGGSFIASADVDLDGFSLLEEYAAGTDPASPTSGRSIAWPVLADDELRLRFRHRVAASDVVYAVEASSDLLSWTSTGVTITEETTSGGFREVEARDPQNRGFLRLRLAEPSAPSL